MTDINELAREIAEATHPDREGMSAYVASVLSYSRKRIVRAALPVLTAWVKERDESVIFHLRQAHEAACHLAPQFARRNTRQHIKEALRELGEGGSDE